MDPSHQPDRLPVAFPQLPKGGGAMRGTGETLSAVGMSGMSNLSLPLPVSPGRSHAPALSLVYSSGNGNSEWGLGWQLQSLSISRKTSMGVPLYQDSDDFLGPNGETLIPELDPYGAIVVTTVSQYGGHTLDQPYRVIRYFPRIEGGFARIERWTPTTTTTGDFWLIHDTGGQLHCMGKSPEARIADPAAPTARIARWLEEESVSPSGEHILHSYQADDANRYLTHVRYGNLRPYAPLYAWGNVPGADQPGWLFTLVFDYGSRSLDAGIAPPWLAPGPWLQRLDPFRDYAFGFELITRRLCHQVLMFHHFPTELGEPATLVRRLLLGYAQSVYVSQLVTAQSLAYERNGDLKAIPPLELAYTPFAPDLAPSHYRELPAFPGWNDARPYQLVDLYGEGLFGVLYKADADWRYLSPQRGDDPDAITYSAWKTLPRIPSLQGQDKATLMDITGDGRLDYLIAQPALKGYFTLSPDGNWSQFVPFQALPAEFLHPSAQLADLVGAGLGDLAMIGPRSVRLYGNRREVGFGAGADIPHPGTDRLPVGEDAPSVLVAFSDVLGSGQQHLVRVQHDRLECWPNLGRGRFGQPLTLAQNLPFDAASFNTSRVFLADLDGSGAADLVYAETDRFLIFRNRAGNGFDTTPLVLPMPAGITYDRLDQVSFADIDGSGTASLVLTISHMAPRHWSYSFCAAKPYLLQTIHNNLGATTRLTYRSSAQEWLDEKKSDAQAVPALPFPVQVVSRVLSIDEITANTLSQQYRYRGGVYAGEDREFRGFGFVLHLDTDSTAAPTAPDVTPTPPTLTKTWYHTGLERAEDDSTVPPYADASVFKLGPARFSTFNATTRIDDLLAAPDASTQHQLHRALKGSLLRVEVYGNDGSAQEAVPYLVETSRHHARLCQAAYPGHPHCVVLPMLLEQLAVNYERIADDPQVQHVVNLQTDAYGTTVREVSIQYPRRSPPPRNPYLPTVTDAQWLSSYDSAQQVLRLNESLQTVHHLTQPSVWRLGLPHQQRQNVLTDPSGYTGYPAIPGAGLSYEALQDPNGVLGRTQARVFVGQQVTFYFDAAGIAAEASGTPPPPLALVHHIETAELDDESLLAYAGIADLRTMLIGAGYAERSMVLPEPDAPDKKVWVVPHSYATYVESGVWLPFHCPRSSQKTLLAGPERLTYDPYSCVVTAIVDALGNRVSAQYDYRFLAPWQITDPNQNRQEARLDALGRIVASAFYGSELDATGAVVSVGFAPVADFNPAVPALDSIEAALADPASALQSAASVTLYALFDWMGQVSRTQLLDGSEPGDPAALWTALQQTHLVTATGHVLAKGHEWANSEQSLPGIPDRLRAAFMAVTRSPAQAAVLAAQQYPGSSSSPIPITVSFSDGFGRALQTLQKTEPGLAYVVDEDGELVMADGKPLVRDTGSAARWRVSGHVEYSNKGQPVRQYQPYFLDQPRHVNATDMRQWGYANTHVYDPMGRKSEVVAPLGFLSRMRYYPWFGMTEDENDTLSGVLAP